MLHKHDCMYTLRRIYKELAFKTSPCLLATTGFSYTKSEVQNSHLTVDQLLSVPGFAETKLEFLYETLE